MANSRRLMHREAATEVSRESAITAHLLGLASIPRLLLRGLLYAVPVALYVILFSAPGMGSARRADPTVPVLLVCVLMISLLPNMSSTEVARRSRTLWLRGSCSREQLFRMSERLSWSALGAVGGPLLSVFIVAWVFAPHPGSNWMYMLFAMLAPGVCSVYLGLMNVSGWHPIDVIAAILVVILGCGAPIVNLAHATEDLTSRMLLLLSAQLLGALALRWVARERWQRIDWLICKPHRLSSQALRPVI